MRFGLAVLVCGLAGLAGCSGGAFGGLDQAKTSGGVAGARLTGSVHGGQQPIVGAHVYLFAASATGYGGAGIAASANNASVSLLTSGTGTTLDAGGGATNGDYYVTTDGSGGFSITGDYTCSAGQQVYLYALGGNPGSGTNSAAGLMAVLGNCPPAGTFSSSLFVAVNEVSTVAAAYAFAGFATDATHVGSSGTALALTGIANAFANASNLVDLPTGAALATTPAGNGTVPQAEINTLGNILASCVNTNGTLYGTRSCTVLLANAPSAGATPAIPTDTAMAMINIAHNPGANVSFLYGLAAATPPFAPGLTSSPTDWTIGLSFSSDALRGCDGIAIDGAGNVWISDFGAGFVRYPNVAKFNSLGASLSGTTGYTGGGLTGPYRVAIDELGNAWVPNPNGNAVVEISSAGSFLSGENGYSTGSSSSLGSIAVDGTGNAWISDGSSVVELSPSGSLLSGAGGYKAGGLSASQGIAIDSSGSVWVPNKSGNVLVAMGGSGVALSGPSGYAGGGLNSPIDVAVDSQGSVWVLNSTTINTVSKFSSTGSSLSGSFGFPFGTNGLQLLPSAIAIDGAGDVWIATYSVGVIQELSNSGSILYGGGYYGYSVQSNAGGIAVDGSGDVWMFNLFGGPVVELVGAAVPVVTPLSVGMKNNMLGTRP